MQGQHCSALKKSDGTFGKKIGSILLGNFSHCETAQGQCAIARQT